MIILKNNCEKVRKKQQKFPFRIIQKSEQKIYSILLDNRNLGKDQEIFLKGNMQIFMFEANTKIVNSRKS